MNNSFHNQTDPNFYVLSKELIKIKKELSVLEKKINLGNDLLAKIDDQGVISKLEKQKKELENEKNNINSKIKKINCLTGSVKDFILFFVFIRRFYTLAILKHNFENADKKNSLRLIDKLKTEEENLYNAYIDGDCFSKVLLVLDFERYQSYFKEFAKSFFENINYTSDPYINSLLRLQNIFFECAHFDSDNFNLTDVKFFLSKNIPVNIPLPESNYERIALRCFFFYELLFWFLTLKPITVHFEDLKKAIILDLSVVDYKANIQNTLIFSLNNLKEALQKINNKYDSFLIRKSIVDKKADINHAIIFYKGLKDEVEIINKKSKLLIDNKYLKLEKMQHLLAIINNEENFPKFLEVFNKKIGNDFSLNSIKNPDIIGTNKEALSYLFHILCKDKFYTSINKKNSFLIKEQTEIYSKEDISILDGLELEDLVEFSFYYIFSLLYSDFNSSLMEFNTKLSYAEMVTSNVFYNIKFQSLEILIKKRKTEIEKFIGKKFKNSIEYNLHRKNILEEINLNLETIQDLNHGLCEIKSLETSLIAKLQDNSIPMPEKTLIFELLKLLEEKQKDCEADYQEITKHKFNNKSESKKITKNKKEKIEQIKNNFFEVLETLSLMSKKLSESLRYIEKTRQEINLFFQKISLEVDQNLASIFKCISNLNSLNNDKAQELKDLNLFELLNLIEQSLIENTLIKDDLKKQLLELITNFRLLTKNLVDQVNVIINKYHNCNSEVEKILNSLSISNPLSQFFLAPIDQEIKSKAKKLYSEYNDLKKQLNFLKRIISLFKCNTDETIKLYSIIKKLDAYYQKLNKNLNKKIRAQFNIKEKNFEKSAKNSLPQSLQSIKEDLEKIPEKIFREERSEKTNPDIVKFSASQDTQTNNRENCLLTEILQSTDACSKMRTRLEGEYANKERAKADLKAITSTSRYNFLISRIDPLNVSIPTTVKNVDSNSSSMDAASCLIVPSTLRADIRETTTYNDTDAGPAFYAPPATAMLFPAPPTIVVDSYRLENRTVFYPI